ncbi:MAG: hypothetical protein AB1762_05840 [Gemmatimonadota bacterium]
MHGEATAQDALADLVRAEGLDVRTPSLGDRVVV